MKKNRSAKINTDAELKAILENEEEASRYAAKCLAVCAGVGAVSWLLNILGIFIIPEKIMNIGMPVTILFFLIPSILCKIIDLKPLWIKYIIIMCGVMGIFILSSAMPKHGILAWAVPLALSCHYYSKELTRFTLVVSWVFFSVSIYIGMYLGGKGFKCDDAGRRNTGQCYGSHAQQHSYLFRAPAGFDPFGNIFHMHYHSGTHAETVRASDQRQRGKAEDIHRA